MGNSKNTVIPEGFKITKCPASDPNRKIKSEYSLLKEEERALELGYSGRVEMLKDKAAKKAASLDAKAQANFKAYEDAFNQARQGGMSVAEALFIANNALNGRK